MALRIKYLLVLAAAFAALLGPGKALAAGGSYAFDGGTASEQKQVRAALSASSFDWSVVPARITIHIQPGGDSHARKGEIWLPAELLHSGRFAWGVVQHEYAHQVDFFLLDDAQRSQLQARLGGATWCGEGGTHGARACERFASSVAWAFWAVSANCMQPTSAEDEAGALTSFEFRALLGSVLHRQLVRVQPIRRVAQIR